MRKYWYCLVALAAITAGFVWTQFAAIDALAQQPAATNGTVVFTTIGGSKGGSATTAECRVCLTVEKPGKGSLTLGPPPTPNTNPPSQNGTHTFPKGSNAAGIAQYYVMLLHAAGYTSPADYTVSGGQINFKDVTKLDGGCSDNQVPVAGSTDSKDIPFESIPDTKVVCLQRDMDWAMDGTVLLIGFGVGTDQVNGTITTSCSAVEIDFSATDTGSDIIQAICTALAARGWTVVVNGNNELEVTSNEQGHRIYSLFHRVWYSPDPTHTENSDHWVFTESD